MLSGYHSPIDAIRDSNDRSFEIARVREQNRKNKDVELTHFKNVITARLGSDPAVARVISTWRSGKDPVNCKMQILGAKSWTMQEQADIEALFRSFKVINTKIWDVEKEFGSNPRVHLLIEKIRNSEDVRVVPFERELNRILKGGI